MTNFNDLIDNITVNELKKRLKALPILNSAAKPTRKADIAKLLFSNLSDKKILTTLYKTLTPYQKLALQESVHNYNGYIDEFSFSSKYKQPFPTNTSKTAYTGRYDSIFSVFFYPERGNSYGYSYRIPQDLLTIIKPHIELPPPFKLETVTQLEDDTLEVNTSINHIENDFNIFLNMMKLNKLKVSAKTGLPSKALLDNLSTQVNEPYNKVTNNGDIHLTSICSFGWIQILSTSTWIKKTTTELTINTKKFPTDQAFHEIIKALFWDWQQKSKQDEFSRIDEVKGQKGKGQKYFTPTLLRREKCINTLKQCPINQWLHINEFIRLMIANKDFLPITQEPSFLYIGDQHYGEIYDGGFLVTAYMRCLLMEYFFTLGLIDIAYCHPTESTDNYFSSENYWDLDCLSRYDGLAYLRLTPLGAYVLKIKDSYTQTKKVSQTSLEFVGRHNIQFKQPPSVNEKIFLTNYAEEKKQNLWVLSSDKILSYLENGADLKELQSFLKNRDTQPYFSNSIESFFKTMESNKSAVNNKGDFKLVTCQSKEVATNIASAPKLKNWCQQVSDTQLIYPKDKHNQFRILIHQLNYGMPI